MEARSVARVRRAGAEAGRRRHGRGVARARRRGGARDRDDRGGAPAPADGGAGREPVQRRAPPGRARARAARPVRGPRPRRADQPPRHPDRGVARGPPRELAGRADRGDPRSLLPRSGRHPDPRGRSRPGLRLRGRLRRVPDEAGRAAVDRIRGRVPAGLVHPARDRLDPPRAAGAHDQGEGADRSVRRGRRRGADHRRGPRPDAVAHPAVRTAARQHDRRARSGVEAARGQAAVRGPDPGDEAGRSDRHRRAQRRRQDDADPDDPRRRAAGRRPGHPRREHAACVPRAGADRAARRADRARGGRRRLRLCRAAGRQGPRAQLPADDGVPRLGRGYPRRQAVGRRAQPRPARAAAAPRRQPARARRADQRSRSPDAGGPRGRADPVPRLRADRRRTIAGSSIASRPRSSRSRVTAR